MDRTNLHPDFIAIREQLAADGIRLTIKQKSWFWRLLGFLLHPINWGVC